MPYGGRGEQAHKKIPRTAVQATGDMGFATYLSIVMHAIVAVFLLVYLPVSRLWTMLRWVLVRPFLKEDMRGKVVLITGASSGIGEQVAYEYARRGASLALSARREQALKAVSMAARKHGAPDVLVITADISNAEEAKRVVDETVAHFGRLNHLVANAGLLSSCLFKDITNITGFRQVVDVNFWGSVYPVYYAIPHLRRSRGKLILNASVAGYIPLARQSIYNASKGALLKFGETLQSELGMEIGITIVNLGYVASELTKGKAVQQNGEVVMDSQVRDIQIGPLPIGGTEQCAEVIVDGACKGDTYITWPTWYKPLCMAMSLAPEVVLWFSRVIYVGMPGSSSGKTLGQTLLELKGAKEFLYPSSILTEAHGKEASKNKGHRTD